MPGVGILPLVENGKEFLAADRGLDNASTARPATTRGFPGLYSVCQRATIACPSSPSNSMSQVQALAFNGIWRN